MRTLPTDDHFRVSLPALEAALARLAADGLENLTGEALKNAQAVASLELLYEATADRVGLYGSEANKAAREQAEFTAKLEDELGVQLLRVLALSGVFIAVALTYTGGLQGSGDTRSPLHISIISQVVVPLGICFVLQQLNTLDPIDIWLAILTGHATRCVLSVIRFNQGQWRSIEIA